MRTDPRRAGIVTTEREIAVPADLFADVIDSLERCDCQFWACEGETLTPIDMVTCHRCSTLARLRTLATGSKPPEQGALGNAPYPPKGAGRA